LYVPETTSVIKLIETLRQARGQIVLVNDEFGVLQGLLSPIDVLEAIAGEFPDEDEVPEIQAAGPGRWQVAGGADLHQLEQVLQTDGLAGSAGGVDSLAGFLLTRFGRLPAVGETWAH